MSITRNNPNYDKYLMYGKFLFSICQNILSV